MLTHYQKMQISRSVARVVGVRIDSVRIRETENNLIVRVVDIVIRFNRYGTQYFPERLPTTRLKSRITQATLHVIAGRDAAINLMRRFENWNGTLREFIEVMRNDFQYGFTQTFEHGFTRWDVRWWLRGERRQHSWVTYPVDEQHEQRIFFSNMYQVINGEIQGEVIMENPN